MKTKKLMPFLLSILFLGAVIQINAAPKLAGLSEAEKVQRFKEEIAHARSTDQQKRICEFCLFNALPDKNMDLINECLKVGKKLGFQDLTRPGKIAFLYIVEHGYFDVAEQLLNAHADIDVRDERNYTMLHKAARNNPAAVNFLLQHGAKVNAENDLVYTPLHVAAMYGNLEVITLLLQAGANKLALTPQGLTAYDIAMHYKHTEAAQLLNPASDFLH